MLRLKIIAPNQTEIRKADGTIVFFSYETPVAAFIPDKGFVRTSTKYSVTTSRHINKWLWGASAAEVCQFVLDNLL